MDNLTFKQIVMGIDDFETRVVFQERVKWIARYPHLEIQAKELLGFTKAQLVAKAQHYETYGEN